MWKLAGEALRLKETVVEHVHGLSHLALNVDVEDHGAKESHHQDTQTGCLDELILKEDLMECVAHEGDLNDEEEDAVREGLCHLLLSHDAVVFRESPPLLISSASQRQGSQLAVQVFLLSLQNGVTILLNEVIDVIVTTGIVQNQRLLVSIKRLKTGDIIHKDVGVESDGVEVLSQLKS